VEELLLQLYLRHAARSQKTLIEIYQLEALKKREQLDQDFKDDKIDFKDYDLTGFKKVPCQFSGIDCVLIYPDDITIKFNDNCRYAYPLPEALKHIVDELPQRGDRILVWNKSEKHPLPRIFLAYIEGAKLPVQVVCPIDVEEFKDGSPFATDKFKYYKTIPQKTKLTLQQIADKFGIDVNELEVER
jgi:hypothetical protein